MALLIEMQFTSGTLRLTTARMPIESGGNTFVASGQLGVVEEVEDKANEIAGLRFSISGVDPSAIAIALGELVRGRPVSLWLAILNADTHALLEAPLLWTGQLDKMRITRDKTGANISVTAEHRGVLFNRAKPVRYTNADQQRLYPGDRCLEYIVSQSATQDIWPSASFFRV